MPARCKPDAFHFPTAFVGYLYLRKYGLSKEVRASVIRGLMNGSWRVASPCDACMTRARRIPPHHLLIGFLAKKL